jgi:hypothetical protein
MTLAALAWRWAWLAVLAVWLIFAHGCHPGDHDDELAIVPVSSPDRPAR